MGCHQTAPSAIRPLQKLNESMPQKGNNSSHLQAAVALFACLADTRNNVKVYAFVRQYIF
jgi:hypothetical protein